MEFIFILIRVPVFLIGLILCLVVLPFDLVFRLIAVTGIHIIIIFFRLVGTPFVIVGSALFDRAWWPRYLKEWEEAHASLKLNLHIPFKRFPQLMTWLGEGR